MKNLKNELVEALKAALLTPSASEDASTEIVVGDSFVKKEDGHVEENSAALTVEIPSVVSDLSMQAATSVAPSNEAPRPSLRTQIIRSSLALEAPASSRISQANASKMCAEEEYKLRLARHRDSQAAKAKYSFSTASVPTLGKPMPVHASMSKWDDEVTGKVSLFREPLEVLQLEMPETAADSCLAVDEEQAVVNKAIEELEEAEEEEEAIITEVKPVKKDAVSATTKPTTLPTSFSSFTVSAAKPSNLVSNQSSFVGGEKPKPVVSALEKARKLRELEEVKLKEKKKLLEEKKVK